MAYIPYDPYNTGIGTPNLGLGNINQGQNRQTAGVWGNIMPEFMGGYSKEEMARNAALKKIESLKIDQMKGIPQGKTEVETQSIIDDLQYTNPDKFKKYQDIEKQIQEIKNQYPKDVDIQSVYLDDDETPYDFSDIESQTAFLDPFSLLTLGSKILGPAYALKSGGINELAKYKIRKDLTDKGWAKTKEILAAKAAAEAAKQKAAADAAAAAPTSHAEARSTGGDYHSGHQSTVGGQTTDWGSESAMIARGGLAQHAPRYANGGLIDFFRYGGFIG